MSDSGARSYALEHDYVHQVYDRIAKALVKTDDPLRSTVQSFLDELEPGSLVADIGCGNGRHLGSKNDIFCFGLDSSAVQTKLTRMLRHQEALLGNNLNLPYRDESFDAVVSVAVLPHFATRDRRLQALKELARILRVGGRVFIAVQQHESMRDSQDVLIPWYDIDAKAHKGKDVFNEENSEEYELDDDCDEDDSMSLPSSDEEDCSTNFRHRIPSASSQNRNNQQIMTVAPQDSCYGFVRRAWMRLSSASSITNEGEGSIDSGLPLSPTRTIDQRTAAHQEGDEEVDCAIPLSCSTQKLVNDNYIELRNLDVKIPNESEKPNDTLKTNGKNPRKKIIRSVSDFFKTLPSMWTSQERSPSDHDLSEDNDLMQTWNRLVRSQTTATCSQTTRSSNLNTSMTLDDIGEIEMTFSEAETIIQKFLEESFSDKSKRTDTQLNYNVNGMTVSLTNSDISNANMICHDDDEIFDGHFLDDVNKGHSSVIGNDRGMRLTDRFQRQMLANEILLKDVACNNSDIQFENRFADAVGLDMRLTQENAHINKYQSQISFCVNNDYDDFDDFNPKHMDLSDKHFLNSTENKFTNDSKSTPNSALLAQDSILFDLDSDLTPYDFSYINKKNLNKKKSKRKDDLVSENCFSIAFARNNEHSENTLIDEKDLKSFQLFEELVESNEMVQNESFNLERSKRAIHKDSSNKSSSLSNSPYKKRTSGHSNWNMVSSKTVSPFITDECFCAMDDKDQSLVLSSYYSMPELYNLNELKTRHYSEQYESLINSSPYQNSNKRLNELIEHSQVFGNDNINKFSDCLECLVTELSNDNGIKNRQKEHDWLNVENNATCWGSTSHSAMRRHSADALRKTLSEKHEYCTCETQQYENQFRNLFPIDPIQNKKYKKRISNSLKGVLHLNCSKCAKYGVERSIDSAKNGPFCNGIEEEPIDNEDEDMSFVQPKLCAFHSLVSTVNRSISTETLNDISVNNYPVVSPDRYNVNLTLSKASEIFSNDAEMLSSEDTVEGVTCKQMTLKHSIQPEKVTSIDKKQIPVKSLPLTNFQRPRHFTEEMDSELSTSFQINISNYSDTFIASKKDMISPHQGHDAFPPLYIESCSDSRTRCEKAKHLISDLSKSGANNSSVNDTNISDDYFSSLKPQHPSKTGASPCEPPLYGSTDEIKLPHAFACESNIIDKNQATNDNKGIVSYPHSPQNLTLSKSIDSKSLKCQKVKDIPHDLQFTEADIAGSVPVHSAYGRAGEEDATVVLHRYHHLFREQELEELIDDHVSDLHILRTFHEQSHWCVIAEKVRVWSI